jgi:hypothetical protein
MAQDEVLVPADLPPQIRMLSREEGREANLRDLHK